MADEKNLLMDFIEKKYPIDKIWEESERTCSEETRTDLSGRETVMLSPLGADTCR